MSDIKVTMHTTTRNIDGIITRGYFMVTFGNKVFYQNAPTGRWVSLGYLPTVEQYRHALDGDVVGSLTSKLLDALVDGRTVEVMQAANIPEGGLKGIRKFLAISQEQLGKRAGYGQRTIAAWETGERTPSITAARDVADALNLICRGRGIQMKFSVDDLFPR